MKLLFCLFNYFPFGGLQRDFLRIARECVRRNYTIDVFTMKWEGDLEPQLNIIKAGPFVAMQNHTRAAAFGRQLQVLRSEKKHDAIIGFNKMPGLDIYYAADTCYQARARKQHGAWYRLMPRYRHFVAYEKAVFADTEKTAILLIAKQQQAEFQRFYHTPDHRFHLLPPGIDKDRIAPPNVVFLREQYRAEWKIAPREFLLLMLGSGFKTKGLDRTLDALAALPSELKQRTKPYVVGKDHPDAFVRQAKKLGIAAQITFLGGRHDAAHFLLAADLLLHPAYNENTGTVLLEALASGLPVLTTDVCGYAHYITEAKAGRVLSSPFQQGQLNEVLAEALLLTQSGDWQKNALNFAKTADIYSMPERAADTIEMLCK